jgi:hypothetical protein
MFSAGVVVGVDYARYTFGIEVAIALIVATTFSDSEITSFC